LFDIHFYFNTVNTSQTADSRQTQRASAGSHRHAVCI